MHIIKCRTLPCVWDDDYAYKFPLRGVVKLDLIGCALHLTTSKGGLSSKGRNLISNLPVRTCTSRCRYHLPPFFLSTSSWLSKSFHMPLNLFLPHFLPPPTVPSCLITTLCSTSYPSFFHSGTTDVWRHKGSHWCSVLRTVFSDKVNIVFLSFFFLSQ